MTRFRSNRPLLRRLYWALVASLVVTVALGVARQLRATVLTAPINEGVSSQIRIANALEISRRVAERFTDIDRHGPAEEVAWWPLRTAADTLLTGGDCGAAAMALGSVFASRGRPFRIIQVNVGPDGAAHIMFETPDDSGKWVLLDPLSGDGFRRPSDDQLMGIDEIRALPVGDRSWLDEDYNGGELSLFAPYRRTNWERFGPMAGAIVAIKGNKWTSETSVRVIVLGADRLLTQGAAFALFLLLCWGLYRAPHRHRRPVPSNLHASG